MISTDNNDIKELLHRLQRGKEIQKAQPLDMENEYYNTLINIVSLHGQEDNTLDSDIIQMMLLRVPIECTMRQNNYVDCCYTLHYIDVNIALVK